MVAAGVTVAVLVALPFSDRPGPTLPGLASAWCTVVLLCDLLAVALLVGLYRNGRGLRMLVLATAFAWSAVSVVALALTTPGIVAAGPWLGDGGGAGWLYLSRHVGPPLLIALAAAAQAATACRDAPPSPAPRSRRRQSAPSRRKDRAGFPDRRGIAARHRSPGGATG